MAISTIIFDLGNVVIKFDIRIIARKLSEKFSLDEDKLFELFFDSPLTGIHDEGKIGGREFHKRAMKMLDIELGFEEFKDIWNDIFTENKEVLKLVLDLSRQYTVFLMSNTNRMHFDYLNDKFGITNKFNRVFTSYEVGERKPHPKIYREAIKYASAKPEDMVFIDDREELVEGAKSVGMRGIRFRDIAQLKEDLIKNGVSLKQ